MILPPLIRLGFSHYNIKERKMKHQLKQVYLYLTFKEKMKEKRKLIHIYSKWTENEGMTRGGYYNENW